jgi:hypothetical protein
VTVDLCSPKPRSSCPRHNTLKDLSYSTRCFWYLPSAAQTKISQLVLLPQNNYADKARPLSSCHPAALNQATRSVAPVISPLLEGFPILCLSLNSSTTHRGFAREGLVIWACTGRTTESLYSSKESLLPSCPHHTLKRLAPVFHVLPSIPL